MSIYNGSFRWTWINQIQQHINTYKWYYQQSFYKANIYVCSTSWMNFSKQKIYFKSVLIVLTQTFGRVASLIPVFECIYQRILVYIPEGDRETLLKLFQNVRIIIFYSNSWIQLFFFKEFEYFHFFNL